MNKQEAIKKIKQLPLVNYSSMEFVEEIINIISQIDEPQKVVVPRHIDEKIRYCKNTEGYGLFHAMDYCYQYKDSAEWLEYNQETFARAWLDGYEIEQEKLYTVEVVGTGQYLVERYKKQGYVFIDTEDPLLFTKAELEQAGFGWVFDCNGVKVEEVDDDTR